MATDKINAMTKLRDITDCCICLKTFTDPRILPCIHTFCLQCLKNLTDKSDKKPEDVLPCPVCRKEFTIPNDGVQGIQKNFFMAGMIEVKNALNQSEEGCRPTQCDVCKADTDFAERDIHVSKATFRCLDCQTNLCGDCYKKHKAFKMMQNHNILKIGSGVGEEEVAKNLNVMNCDIHRGRTLDYYCAECKIVVCVSCFVESHKTHDCKDVTTLEEEFRHMIKFNGEKISSLARELLAKKDKSESKENFLEKVARSEEEILKKSEALKEMIDENTKSLLSSLDEIKNRRLKEIQTKEDELERRITILESFSRYCDELRSKGSASDVCRSKDEILRRADELDDDHEKYVMQPNTSIDVAFQATDLTEFLKVTNGSIAGSLKEQDECLEDFAVLIGKPDLLPTLYRINLHHPKEVSPVVESAPIAVGYCPSVAVYNNTMFITGIGDSLNEIWKYNLASGWNICGSLVQGRQYQCAEFIDDILYICGGSKGDTVLNSIESYNTLTENTTIVGQLKFGTFYAACVTYKGSIFVFGGIDQDKPLDCVQVFNPVDGTCTLLSTPSPRPSGWMRAVSWDSLAILMSRDSCFIFDFDGKTWQERKQFQEDSYSYYRGMILHNKRLFTIDGGRCRNEDNVKYVRTASILNNEAPKWKHYCQLPKPFAVVATAQLFSVKQSS